jgi:hypothetical protein
MKIAASFPAVKKPRFNRSGEEQTMRLKLMRTGLATASDNLYMAHHPSFALPAATWNLHTHNQVLCSQLAMRFSISPVCLKQRL